MRRRDVLGGLAAVGLSAPGLSANAWAATLARTPSQSEGPFYPDPKPESRDWDLLRLRAGDRPAAGEPLALSGRVLDAAGRPVSDAVVEIWQADASGIYRHRRAPRTESFDDAFQGYGAARTDPQGRYRFLTIVPVPYTGRPPHIHAKLWTEGREALTTQLYLRGHPDNDRDGLLGRLFGASREALMMDLHPARLADGLAGKRTAFDFVI